MKVMNINKSGGYGFSTLYRVPSGKVAKIILNTVNGEKVGSPPIDYELRLGGACFYFTTQSEIYSNKRVSNTFSFGGSDLMVITGGNSYVTVPRVHYLTSGERIQAGYRENYTYKKTLKMSVSFTVFEESI